MIRRLFKTGNNVVISLLLETLANLGIKKKMTYHFASGIDTDFANQVNDFIDTYRLALDELAK